MTSIPDTIITSCYLVLKDKAGQIAEAVRPGVSGDPYESLADWEAAVLTEITKLGVPLLLSWEDEEGNASISTCSSVYLSPHQCFVNATVACSPLRTWLALSPTVLSLPILLKLTDTSSLLGDISTMIRPLRHSVSSIPIFNKLIPHTRATFGPPKATWARKRLCFQQDHRHEKNDESDVVSFSVADYPTDRKLRGVDFDLIDESGSVVADCTGTLDTKTNTFNPKEPLKSDVTLDGCSLLCDNSWFLSCHAFH
jgi:hypothetical protein